MRVVVTGASGFIGRNLLLQAPRDWEIVAVYRQTPLDDFVARHALSQVRTVRADLLNADDVRQVARAVAGRADAVMYLAANGDPAASAERPRWDLESNTTALVSFLEHCPAEHVVYMSSGAVYDGLRGDVSPATPVSPRLPYAIAKLASEQYLRFFAEHRRTVGSYINVRFFGAYGPYEAERKITTRWLRALNAGQREFVIRGDGRNLIDFMYVDDAVAGLVRLLQARGTSCTVDFGGGAPVTVNDVAQAMAGALGVTITIRHEGVVPEYIEFRSVDRTMRETFGVTPSIPFDEGFRRFNRFFAGEARVAH
jgi:nucleoside-diphosphate-sugar epimerase